MCDYYLLTFFCRNHQVWFRDSQFLKVNMARPLKRSHRQNMKISLHTNTHNNNQKKTNYARKMVKQICLPYSPISRTFGCRVRIRHMETRTSFDKFVSIVKTSFAMVCFCLLYSCVVFVVIF